MNKNKLDISWLCRDCHSFVHRVLRAIKEPLRELETTGSAGSAWYTPTMPVRRTVAGIARTPAELPV